jgi:hypothetical protein
MIMLQCCFYVSGAAKTKRRLYAGQFKFMDFTFLEIVFTKAQVPDINSV